MNKEGSKNKPSHTKHPLSYRIVLYLFVVATLIFTFQAARNVPFLFNSDMYSTYTMSFIINTFILLLLTISSWYALYKMNQQENATWGYFFIIPLGYALYSLIQLVTTLRGAQLLKGFTDLFSFDHFFIYGISLVLYVIGLALFVSRFFQSKKR